MTIAEEFASEGYLPDGCVTIKDCTEHFYEKFLQKISLRFIMGYGKENMGLKI